MSDKKNVEMTSDEMVAKAKDFWTRNSKPILIVSAAIILLGGGWLVYKNFFKAPKEANANDALFRAQSYLEKDSINLALNGDGQSMGFLRIINKFGGTNAANLSHYYAGICYTKLDDNEKAISHLKDFSTSSKPVQARAYKLLAEAYAATGKNSEALSNYKKAASEFETDKTYSSEALFDAAFFADRVMKDKKEAIELYKELKEKYPNTDKGNKAENYLAQLGVYNVN